MKELQIQNYRISKAVYLSGVLECSSIDGVAEARGLVPDQVIAMNMQAKVQTKGIPWDTLKLPQYDFFSVVGEVARVEGGYERRGRWVGLGWMM